MKLENNFKNHLSEYIFLNDNYLLKQRETLFNKIKSNKYDKKNNESLKNINFSDLSIFDYYYNTSNTNPTTLMQENGNYLINIVNGRCIDYEDDNIKIKNISSDDFKKFHDQTNENLNDIVVDLNKIFLNSGIFFNVKKNKKIKLKIIHKTDENFTIFQNNFFDFDNSSNVSIEEEFNLSKNTINNINHNIYVNEYSKVDHKVFQNFSHENKLYLTSDTYCKKNSSFKHKTYNFSDGFVRNFHNAKLGGEFSYAALSGCFFLKDTNVCTNKTYINHIGENCESNQTYKGILNNHSKANYYSNTMVSQNAQKTEGYQLSKGILLSDNCSFFSKPELRIFADDVKCSHGSTIGPVDESALYYLRSRGISKKQAMKMIVSSFIEEDLQDLDNVYVNKINICLSKYLNSIE